jgi:flagellar protein FliL
MGKWLQPPVVFMILALSLCSVGLYAAEEQVPEEEVKEGATAIFDKPMYVSIKPAFVVNYGGTGKLQYLKIEISLRVVDVHASNAVRHHMPLIRDYLVSLFSRQVDEDIATQEGKEQLRLTALAGVQKVLMDEDGEQDVKDLFFSHFIVQR